MKRLLILSCALLCSCASITTSPVAMELAAQSATVSILAVLGSQGRTAAPQVYTIAGAIRSLEGGQTVTAAQLQSVITLFTKNTQIASIGVAAGTALASVWQMYYPGGTSNTAAIEALAAGVEAGASIFMPQAAAHRHG